MRKVAGKKKDDFALRVAEACRSRFVKLESTIVDLALRIQEIVNADAKHRSWDDLERLIAKLDRDLDVLGRARIQSESTLENHSMNIDEAFKELRNMRHEFTLAIAGVKATRPTPPDFEVAMNMMQKKVDAVAAQQRSSWSERWRGWQTRVYGRWMGAAA